MNRSGFRAFAPLASAALLACAGCGREDRSDRVLARDSAGVRYVEHLSLDSLPSRTAETEAAVRIGATEGDAGALDRVAGGVVLADGRIVLLNAGTAEVRFYDGAGALQATQGREGDGPDEYRNPSMLLAGAADSVVVWDVAHKRATVLAPDGTVGRSVTLGGELRFPLLAGTFAGGDLLVVDRSLAFTPGSAVQTEMGHDLLYDAGGQQKAKLGDHPVRTVQLLSDGVPVTALGPQNRVEIRMVPFAQETQRAAVPDGYWIGRQRGPELAFIDAGGTLRMLVRWLAVPAAVTEADRRAFLDRLIEQSPNEEARATLRAGGTEAFAFAETVPSYGALVAATDGALWMSAYPRPGEAGAQRWTVFGRDGVAREEVRLPAGSTLLWASPERVLLLLRDELGVERVELRPLRDG